MIQSLKLKTMRQRLQPQHLGSFFGDNDMKNGLEKQVIRDTIGESQKK